MRNSVIAAALALAIGFTGVQEAAAQQNLIGVKGGFVSANVDEDGAAARTSMGFGGFARFGVAEAFSVQPEVLYVQKGFGGEDGGVEGEFQLDYIQVPVLVQYHFPLEGKVSPRLFAGPSVAFELACDVAGEGVEVGCDTLNEFGLDFSTASADFGLVFGAGVDVEAGSVTVTFDGRYDMGMTDIFEIDGESDLKNRAWEFFAGVGLPFGP